MLQESPKLSGIRKNRHGHPKMNPIKPGTSRTRKLSNNEWSQPLSKYPKTIYYQSGIKPK